MILLCYDGSTDAQAAIDHAAQLMGGTQATVLTIWEPFVDIMTRSGSMGIGIGWAGTYADDQKIDGASRQAALQTADEGAHRATAVGLVAQPRIARRDGATAQSILAVADELDADLVVLGTRGLGAVKSFLLGSVSHDVIQHADRAVLVVPSGDLAEQRRDRAANDAVITGSDASSRVLEPT